MSTSDAEVRQILIAGMPPGFADLWDLRYDQAGNPKSLMAALLAALGQTHNATAFVYRDQLQQEVNPLTMSADVPAWEQALGLSQTWAALLGTLPQRQQQVVGKLRESGDASFNSIRAVIQPYFQYTDPSKIQIVETDRLALIAAHTYFFGGTPAALPPAATPASVTVSVADDPMCSRAGAQVLLNLTGVLDEIGFLLTGPGADLADIVFFPPGFLGTGSVTNATFRLDAPQLADRRIRGTWTLSFWRNTNAGTLNSAALFVEGIGANADGSNGLGGAAHEWGVVFDSTLVIPGATYDLIGAYGAIQRIKPAHTRGTIILAGTNPNGLLAIPDAPQTIPDEIVPN